MGDHAKLFGIKLQFNSASFYPAQTFECISTFESHVFIPHAFWPRYRRLLERLSFFLFFLLKIIETGKEESPKIYQL